MVLTGKATDYYEPMKYTFIIDNIHHIKPITLYIEIGTYRII